MQRLETLAAPVLQVVGVISNNLGKPLESLCDTIILNKIMVVVFHFAPLRQCAVHVPFRRESNIL